jgi:hypothetical protein
MPHLSPWVSIRVHLWLYFSSLVAACRAVPIYVSYNHVWDRGFCDLYLFYISCELKGRIIYSW